MTGTKAGGLLAKQKNLEHDPDFYHRIGKLGGKASRGYKFAHGKLDPHKTGKFGGQISSRRIYA